MSLLATGAGGLRSPLPNGTRSLIIVFSSPEKPIQAGAAINVLEDDELTPGMEDFPVQMSFWAKESSVFAQPGAKFDIWYGRIVGEGRITGIADEA